MAEVGKKDKFLGGKQREKIRRLANITIKTCYRSVCNHPFVVVMLLILFLLYRSFPFLFSLLVSASPVLICTAILLGVLLSFGQPNIPEIERDDEITITTTNHETASLRTTLHNDATFLEKDEGFMAGRFSVRRNGVVEKLIAEETFLNGMLTGVGKSDSSTPSNATPLEETSREIQLEKKLNEEEEEERGLDESELEAKNGLNEKLDDVYGVDDENQYTQIENGEDENVDFLHDQSSPVGSFDSCMADRADSSPCSPWKRVGEEDVDDEASDTESDGAESSSPDASMADIIPMLDELHPLLDEDAPQPAQMSHDGSDAGSEGSQRSSENTNESNVDSDNQEEEAGEEEDDDHADEEEEDDDHDDEEEEEEEEEEETQDEKDDAIKSAITWTETDQKNLMDLGTSELERNQRLESLIARRRARRMMTEKNLIDLDNFDLPFSVAPISTARRNPFDSSYDSHIPGLPPIPGSAPSIMLARSNPFDLPYDSSEEKPDLTGDNFQQEIVSLPPKDPFFRRHESFSVGPSFFGPPKQETRFRPYFVPEHMASEGTSYSTFERQLSELSDSKVSSVPETESVGSVGDQDDKKLVEEDLSQEQELISHIEHPAELVGHGSESSEDEHVVELGQVEKRDVEQDEVEIELGDGGNHHETISSFSEPRDVATSAESENGGVPLDTRPDEVNCSSRSSSSSLSEMSERIFVDKDDEVSHFEPATADVIEESSLQTQTSLDGSGLNINVGMEDQGHHIEPVYDTSPTSMSISSDLLVDTRTSVITEITDTVIGYASVNSCLSPVEEALESHIVKQDRSFQHEEIHLPSSGSGVDMNSVSSTSKSAGDPILSVSEEDPSPVTSEQASDFQSVASSENETAGRHMFNIDEAIMIKQDQGDLSSLDMIAHVSAGPVANGDSEETVLESENRQPSLEKDSFELHAENHGEIIEPPIQQVESIVEANPISDLPASEVHESEVQQLNLSSEEGDAQEVHQNEDISEVSDEINEIDERLLNELDVVGDFSVGESGPDPIKIEARNIDDIYSNLNRNEELPTKPETEIDGARSLGYSEFKDAIGSSYTDKNRSDSHEDGPVFGEVKDLGEAKVEFHDSETSPKVTSLDIKIPVGDELTKPDSRTESVDESETKEVVSSEEKKTTQKESGGSD